MTHRSLFVTFSDMECVLKDGVHDPSDAKGGLDNVGDNFLHCGQRRQTEVRKDISPKCHSTRLLGVKLTVQSLLESLHADHVLCEFECLAFCLDGELPAE